MIDAVAKADAILFDNLETFSAMANWIPSRKRPRYRPGYFEGVKTEWLLVGLRLTVQMLLAMKHARSLSTPGSVPTDHMHRVHSVRNMVGIFVPEHLRGMRQR